MGPACSNPYRGLPATSFWRRGVVDVEAGAFDPVVTTPFCVARHDAVATAGSCFAQHISKALIGEGIRFVRTEAAHPDEAADLPVYSARFGNIYTCRQLLQLFQRAYGLVEPDVSPWRRPDGRIVDPFRPNEFPGGFADAAAMEAARERHLAAVREMFERCDVFVFTLGLTECWVADADGSALPLAPGVMATPTRPGETFSPRNFTAEEMSRDLLSVIDEMRLVNPKLRVVLTVSPVPLVATFEARHVVVSNTYSKAALRVAAQVAADGRRDVLYFPSYEMILANPKARYVEDDLRSVTPEGVAAVMHVFRTRLLSTTAEPEIAPADRQDATPAEGEPPPREADHGARSRRSLEDEFKRVVCDEEMLAR